MQSLGVPLGTMIGRSWRSRRARATTDRMFLAGDDPALHVDGEDGDAVLAAKLYQLLARRRDRRRAEPTTAHEGGIAPDEGERLRRGEDVNDVDAFHLGVGRSHSSTIQALLPPWTVGAFPAASGAMGIQKLVDALRPGIGSMTLQSPRERYGCL